MLTLNIWPCSLNIVFTECFVFISVVAQSSITTIETKFAQADEELLQLRANLKHYESLVDDYKSQVSW